MEKKPKIIEARIEGKGEKKWIEEKSGQKKKRRKGVDGRKKWMEEKSGEKKKKRKGVDKEKIDT